MISCRLNIVCSLLGVLCLIATLSACTEVKLEGSRTDDKLLASIGDKKLYLSEIAALIPENSTQQDSTLVLTAFAENWAREVVVLLNAEKRYLRIST